MHTLVIAGTFEIAESVMKFYALQDPEFAKAPRIFVPGQPGVIDPDLFRSKYDYSSAAGAYQALLGTAPKRIIISADYLRWNLAPGRITTLWRMIQTTALRYDTRVVFA